MGCCCGSISKSDRESRATRRSGDLEAALPRPVNTEAVKEEDNGPPPAFEKHEEAFILSVHDREPDSVSETSSGHNIVTSTLGHLVGPDSARTSIQLSDANSIQRASFHTEFACLQFHESDKISLIGFPSAVLDNLNNFISEQWTKGVQQSVAESDRSHFFKLRGSPWVRSGPDSVQARRLTKGLLETLYNSGWVLNLTSSVAAIGMPNKDALIFRHQDPAPAECDWMSISFSHTGSAFKLEFIDAPSDVIQLMGSALAPWVVLQSVLPGHGVNEFELKSDAFGSVKKSQAPQALILTILPALEKCGFTVGAAIDQTNSGGNPDTWHCCRPVGWTPGLPVFHR